MTVVELQTSIVARKPHYGSAQADETRNADHGGALESWSSFHSRDPGGVPGARQASLYDDSDHGIPAGDEEGLAACEEDQQRPHLRSGRLASCRAESPDR